MEGLLLAHDRIASTTDRTPAAFVHSSTDAFMNKIHNQSANIINNNVLKVCFTGHLSINNRKSHICCPIATRTN